MHRSRGRWSSRWNTKQSHSQVRRFRPSHLVGPYVCSAGELLALPSLLCMTIDGGSQDSLERKSGKLSARRLVFQRSGIARAASLHASSTPNSDFLAGARREAISAICLEPGMASRVERVMCRQPVLGGCLYSQGARSGRQERQALCCSNTASFDTSHKRLRPGAL